MKLKSLVKVFSCLLLLCACSTSNENISSSSSSLSSSSITSDSSTFDSSSTNQSSSTSLNSTTSTTSSSPSIQESSSSSSSEVIKYQVTVVNGTIQGYGSETSIRVPVNTSLTIVANKPDENKEFLNWTLENNQIFSILATYTFNVITDMQITANYQDKVVTTGYKISFSAGFANDVTNNVEAINNVTDTFTFPQGYTRSSNIAFLGWALTPLDHENLYQPGTSYDKTITSDLLFYAVWDEDWTEWL